MCLGTVVLLKLNVAAGLCSPCARGGTRKKHVSSQSSCLDAFGELWRKPCLFTRVCCLCARRGGKPHDQCFCRPGALPGSSPGIPGILPGISPEFPGVFPGKCWKQPWFQTTLDWDTWALAFFPLDFMSRGHRDSKTQCVRKLVPPCTRGELGKSCLFIGLLPRRFRGSLIETRCGHDVCCLSARGRGEGSTREFAGILRGISRDFPGEFLGNSPGIPGEIPGSVFVLDEI